MLKLKTGKGAGKESFSHTTGGNVNWYHLSRANWQYTGLAKKFVRKMLQKNTNELFGQPNILGLKVVG